MIWLHMIWPHDGLDDEGHLLDGLDDEGYKISALHQIANKNLKAEIHSRYDYHTKVLQISGRKGALFLLTRFIQGLGWTVPTWNTGEQFT